MTAGRSRPTRSMRSSRTFEVDPDEPEQSEDPVLKRLFPERVPGRPGRLVGLPPVHRARAEGQEGRRRPGRPGPARGTELGAGTISRSRRTRSSAWLRTLTSVRLAVATRLGITDAETADELAELPRRTREASWSASTTGLGSRRKP